MQNDATYLLKDIKLEDNLDDRYLWRELIDTLNGSSEIPVEELVELIENADDHVVSAKLLKTILLSILSRMQKIQLTIDGKQYELYGIQLNETM